MINRPIVNLENHSHYLNLIVILAPLMNFFSSICFVLYAPSMPIIAEYFSTSTMIVKNTMTITMIGFALGSLIFGVLMDFYGRRTPLIIAMFLFIGVSLLAPQAKNISDLMLIRFLQGLLTAACSIASRAIIVDYFQGKQFFVVILYTTMAYSFGLIAAPFFGGYLQYYAGWKANFYAYASIAILIELCLLIFVKESMITKANDHSLKKAIDGYGFVLKHKILLAGIIILSIVLMEQLIYPTVGVFLVQNNLGLSSVEYGKTALFVGLCYMSGTIVNLILLNYLSRKKLVQLGLMIMLLAAGVQVILGLFSTLNIGGLLIPILVFNFGLGFIFGNVVGFCLQLFPKNAGINIAVQTCYLMAISALGIYIMSLLNITKLLTVSIIYLTLALMQVGVFQLFIKEKFDDI